MQDVVLNNLKLPYCLCLNRQTKVINYDITLYRTKNVNLITDDLAVYFNAKQIGEKITNLYVQFSL